LDNREFKIYLIENLVNGKVYIGKTVEKINRRWTNHKSMARKGSPIYFYRALRKYGFENFDVRQIDLVYTEQEANEREKFWILFFHSHRPENGYNGTMGGDGTVPTEELKARLIEIGKTFKHHTEEAKQRISKAMLGNKKSPETIEKMKIAAAKREEDKFLKTVAWS
jgi:group I intron endonuclease